MRPTLALAAATVLAAGTLGTAHADDGTAHQAASTAAGPRAAAAATSIGQVGAGDCGINGPAAVVINTQAAGVPSYVAPSNGVLTSFSHQANFKAGKIQAVVFADGATATQKTVVAKSAKLTVTVNQLNTFAIRLPVKAGQRLGLGYSAKDMACATTGGTGDATLVKTPFDPDAASAFVADGVLSQGNLTFRPNISAVLEPDADADGFGDVTQDACPRSALTTAVCPEPDTTITKKPKHPRTHTKVKVKVKFTASMAGSTFECRLDGHQKWKPCTSPYQRWLGVGPHRLQVRAVSPVGIPDPRPAKVKFTISRS